MGAPFDAASGAVRALLVEAGEQLCAVPVQQVVRITQALPVHPLLGTAPELLGLAEFTGEPIPVLDLSRLVEAPPGPRPANPVTVVAWAGPPEARELVGLAADAALEIAEIAPTDAAARGAGALCGDASVGGRPVRVLNLEALGAP